MDDFKIFIGYDSQEPVAYHVLSYSILSRSTSPVSITPLMIDQVRSIYTRQRGPTESTEFSMTRFLVPYLCRYEGWAVYMDCDMLCRVDINALRIDTAKQWNKAVLVCQHDYTPHNSTKFRGQVQTIYPRKNWSSLMLFNNKLCGNLTPEYINRVEPLKLHRFAWLDEPNEIGSLPLEWNWLVGEYQPNPKACIYHYTQGGPWYKDYAQCDHADLWLEEWYKLKDQLSLGI